MASVPHPGTSPSTARATRPRFAAVARASAPPFVIFALGMVGCGDPGAAPPGPVARVEGLPAAVELVPGDDTTLRLIAYDAAGVRVPSPALSWWAQNDQSGGAGIIEMEGGGWTAEGAANTVRARRPGGAFISIFETGHTDRVRATVHFAVGRLTGMAADYVYALYERPYAFPRLRPQAAWTFDSTTTGLPPLGALAPDGAYMPPPTPPVTEWTNYPLRGDAMTYVGVPRRETRAAVRYRGAADAVNVILVPGVWLARRLGAGLYFYDPTPPVIALRELVSDRTLVWAVEPATGQRLPGTPSWSTPDTTLATVDSAGVLRVKRPGRGTLVASFPEYALSASLPLVYEPR